MGPKTEISQSRMIVALNVKILLRKLKRVQYVATDVSRGGMDVVGALIKTTNTFKICLCSLVLLQMRRQASTWPFF